MIAKLNKPCSGLFHRELFNHEIEILLSKIYQELVKYDLVNHVRASHPWLFYVSHIPHKTLYYETTEIDIDDSVLHLPNTIAFLLLHCS